MSAPTVLIVDDEKNIRLTLSSALEALNILADTASSGEEALQKLAEKSFKLMLLDFKLPGLNGLEVLRRVTDNYPDLKVIIMTAYGSIEVAVEAMKTGAMDFLQKPLIQTWCTTWRAASLKDLRKVNRPGNTNTISTWLSSILRPGSLTLSGFMPTRPFFSSIIGRRPIIFWGGM